MAMETRVVLITVPDMAQASRIANELVSKRLAACTSILPGLQSVYYWKGAVQQDNECLLIIKTTKIHIPEMEQLIESIHPYEVPEFIVFNPDYLGAKYSSWLVESLK